MILIAIRSMPVEAGMAVLAAFVRARWLAATLRTREDVLRHQRRQMASWRAALATHFPHLKAEDLEMDKGQLMANFATYNRAGISAHTVRNALDRGEAAEGGLAPGLYCGVSSGTSGNRGLYIITEAERYRWLGTILAKGLPDVWRRRHRVAVILPQSSALYRAGNQSRWLKLAFFDLRQGPASWEDALADFDPTVIIAPPKILRWLAENADLGRLRPQRLFAGAETLDPPDRWLVEAAFSLRLGQIYMATEGLFAISCSEGRLHLTEDFVRFEFEPVGDQLVTPIVTDFSRHFQLTCRYRMNDLLRLGGRGCPCGSPLQIVDAVEGRQDDVFWFGDRMVTPDVLRNAVLDCSPSITDFRIQQRLDGSVELRLPSTVEPVVQKSALAALEGALHKAVPVQRCSPDENEQTEGPILVRLANWNLTPDQLLSRKLRRVERLKR